MRSSTAFLRFANLFTAYEVMENTSVIPITGSFTTLFTGTFHDVIIDSFVMIQVSLDPIKTSNPGRFQFFIQDLGGTAVMRYLRSGFTPTMHVTGLETGSFGHVDNTFWMRCITPGTFRFELRGVAVPLDGRIDPLLMNAEVYVFK